MFQSAILALIRDESLDVDPLDSIETKGIEHRLVVKTVKVNRCSVI